MRVYEVIKTCTVSYREFDNSNVCSSNDFVLYTGDFIFIDNAGWILSENKRYYRPIDKLVSIYHNKLINFEGDKEWTWIKDIDVIDPLINKVFDVEYAAEKCNMLRDVTISWERNLKLEKIT